MKNVPEKIERIVIDQSRYFKNEKVLKRALKKSALQNTELVAYNARHTYKLAHIEAAKQHGVKTKVLKRDSFFVINTEDPEDTSKFEGYWCFAERHDPILNNLTPDFLAARYTWLTLNEGYTFRLSSAWQGNSNFFVAQEDSMLDIPFDNLYHFVYPTSSLQAAIDIINTHEGDELFIWAHGLRPDRAVPYVIKLQSRTEQALKHLTVYFILDETPRLYDASDEAIVVWRTIVDRQYSYYRIIDKDEIVTYEQREKTTRTVTILNEDHVVSQALEYLNLHGAVEFFDEKPKNDTDKKRQFVAAYA